MKWPWIPRSLYDDAVQAARLERLALVELLEHEQRRVEYLTDQIINMKLSGGVVARAALTPTPDGRLARRPSSAIQQAIDENKYASSDPRLRRYLTTWAERELAKEGVTEARVLTTLRTWSNAQEGDDDTDDDDDELAIAIGSEQATIGDREDSAL